MNHEKILLDEPWLEDGEGDELYCLDDYALECVDSDFLSWVSFYLARQKMLIFEKWEIEQIEQGEYINKYVRYGRYPLEKAILFGSKSSGIVPVDLQREL